MRDITANACVDSGVLLLLSTLHAAGARRRRYRAGTGATAGPLLYRTPYLLLATTTVHERQRMSRLALFVHFTFLCYVRRGMPATTRDRRPRQPRRRRCRPSAPAAPRAEPAEVDLVALHRPARATAAAAQAVPAEGVLRAEDRRRASGGDAPATSGSASPTVSAHPSSAAAPERN